MKLFKSSLDRKIKNHETSVARLGSGFDFDKYKVGDSYYDWIITKRKIEHCWDIDINKPGCPRYDYNVLNIWGIKKALLDPNSPVPEEVLSASDCQEFENTGFVYGCPYCKNRDSSIPFFQYTVCEKCGGKYKL